MKLGVVGIRCGGRKREGLANAWEGYFWVMEVLMKASTSI